MVAVAAVTFSSCNKDDDKKDVSIVGKWEYMKTSGSYDGIPFSEAYEHECSTKKDYVELKKDGTAVTVEYDSDCTSDSDNATWSKSGSKLTFKPTGEPMEEYQIVELSKNVLKIKQEGTEDGYDFSITIEFKR